MEDNILEVVNSEGQLEKINVLKYFTIPSLGKEYIIYRDVNNKKNDYYIYSAEIVETDKELILKEVVDEVAKKKIDKIAGELTNG